ncbi:hypothetical protein WKR98_13440 [Pigmentiphaga sp. YJ18]|uniref:hypothetical protein n=1 Tax=Pigmentiphaga sp. YJ18 TaxID=3134907 RepID=UPI00310E4C90
MNTPNEATTVEVLDPERFLVAYKPYKAAIAELTQKYQGVQFDVETTKGLEAAKAARREILEPVYATEKLRKQLKAPALEFAKRIDGDAKEIDTALRKLADPIEAQIKAREAAIEAEKEAKRLAEVRRQEELTRKISGIRQTVAEAAGQPSTYIAQIISDLALWGTEVSLEIFGDRTGEAQLALDETRRRLADMKAQAEEREAEAARLEAERKAEAERLAAERAELERLRAEQAERDRAAREQREAEEKAAAQARAAEEAKLQAEREALAAERRAAEQRQAEAAARAKAEQEAAQRKLDEEREAFERQKREAAEAEQRRIQAEEEARARAALEEARQKREREEAERREREAEQDRLHRASRAMLDALLDWRHAEASGDADELECARNARDAAIAAATQPEPATV